MFNPDIQVGVVRNLKFLEEARELYRTHRKLYNSIKALPMKSRTVREIGKHPHSTIVYLSSPQKVEYYWVKADSKALSIPFLDAMDIMKAAMEEKPGDFAKVMDFHYDQVKLALESYQKVVRKVVDAESMENRKKDKSTNAVLSILRTMNRALNAVNAEKTVAQIKKLEQIVELGVFIGLNSSINSFNRQVKKQKPSSEELITQIIDKIDELFDRYNIPLDTDEERNEEILEPQIVVSESFI